MQRVETYNNNKEIIKSLTKQNKDDKVAVFSEIAVLIEELKLEGLTSKKAKVEAIKTLTTKYPNCSYEVALVKFALVTLDIKANKIEKVADKLHKIRLQFNKQEITKKEIYKLLD